jgi:hypothetical protein
MTQKATTLTAADITDLPYPDSGDLEISPNEQIVADDIIDYYRDFVRLGEESAMSAGSAATRRGCAASPASTRVRSAASTPTCARCRRIAGPGSCVSPSSSAPARSTGPTPTAARPTHALLVERRGGGLTIHRVVAHLRRPLRLPAQARPPALLAALGGAARRRRDARDLRRGRVCSRHARRRRHTLGQRRHARPRSVRRRHLSLAAGSSRSSPASWRAGATTRTAAPCSRSAQLNDQLSSYLNSAARQLPLDAIQFCDRGPRQRLQRGRTVDIAAIRPIGAPIVVDRPPLHPEFDVILPIECKRLPTPADRDEREYVFSGDDTRSGGGIQRFKQGAHGRAHTMAVMIGYIQDGPASQWLARVNHWIAELELVDPTWTAERLAMVATSEAGVCELRSLHRRPVRDGAQIELRHLWVTLGA